MTDAAERTAPKADAQDLTLEVKDGYEVTADEYERACVALGLPPQGPATTADVEGLTWPGLDRAERFLDLALHNAEAVNLREDYTRAGAEEVLGTVAAFFLSEQLMPSKKLISELKKLQSAPTSSSRKEAGPTSHSERT